jgi:hypothetical protein
MDENHPARLEALDRLGRAMQVPEQAESLLSAAANAVGEVVYVCALPSDTLGWVAAQLGPNGDALNAAVTGQERSRPRLGTHVLTWAFGLERVTRIELALSAWEADVLPLNYTRADRWRSQPFGPAEVVFAQTSYRTR